MKLRNKKTGDTTHIHTLCVYADNEFFDYDTIDKLNEDWEDYKPAEPLIKDEKIRKAVRAWAEATKVKSVWYDCYHHTLRNRHTQADKHIGCGEALGLCEDTLYTIDELCGEVEE